MFLCCLTSQQHASVSQGRICSDNFTRCHIETEAADPTFHLTRSQYTDTGPTSPSTDPITPGAWQGSHWSANFLSHWYGSIREKIPSQAGFEPEIFRSRGEGGVSKSLPRAVQAFRNGTPDQAVHHVLPRGRRPHPRCLSIIVANQLRSAF